ncbi:hypothetical protein Dimus_014999 [Dionaea muscipula]
MGSWKQSGTRGNKVDTVLTMNRFRLFKILMGFVFLCLFFITAQYPLLSSSVSPSKPPISLLNPNPRKPFNLLSNLSLVERKSDNSSIYRSAMQAWEVGTQLWSQLQGKKPQTHLENRAGNQIGSCPFEITLTGYQFWKSEKTMELPCGLTLGSHVTVVAKPRTAHSEYRPGNSGLVDEALVSQFMLELRNVKVVPGEDPPRILHFNPRIKGDWSKKPVIEMNSFYRREWGTPVRCEGWPSKPDEETVDGQVWCEEWIRDDDDDVQLEGSKAVWWFNKLIRLMKREPIKWPYPFSEDKFFVLTISAGLEGYHISVDGRHITSFAYRTGYDLDDATGLHLYGDIVVHSVHAASLPASHPSLVPQKHLEMRDEWKAPPFADGPVELFIGILSTVDHFAERMAVRKSWLQHPLIRSLVVVARFFVALHEREAINMELKKEAEFFGDIVIVPFLDNYSLVVLKTIAICEVGVNSVSANYIMKCDDDTFVRVDAVVSEAKGVNGGKSCFLGKMNFYHKPLRKGKWAVTYEEWPEDYYPPYSDGAGYIISSDIAHFIVSEFEKGKLRLFKMEDVSMGMWVQQFSNTRPVEYLHDSRFHQSGCMDGYFSAHYQSPKQMICLWQKMQIEGKPECCNLR